VSGQKDVLGTIVIPRGVELIGPQDEELPSGEDIDVTAA
jgi:hypothetical protein